MTNPFKGMNKKQKTAFRNLIKIMACGLDCEKCKKTPRECLQDTRFCINLLLKERNEKIKKDKEKQSKSESYVS